MRSCRQTAPERLEGSRNRTSSAVPSSRQLHLNGGNAHAAPCDRGLPVACPMRQTPCLSLGAVARVGGRRRGGRRSRQGRGRGRRGKPHDASESGAGKAQGREPAPGRARWPAATADGLRLVGTAEPSHSPAHQKGVDRIPDVSGTGLPVQFQWRVRVCPQVSSVRDYAGPKRSRLLGLIVWPIIIGLLCVSVCTATTTKQGRALL